MPFRDVIGHRPLIGLLTRSVLRASLPPSLIFEGTPGVGKRLTAVALAQALNCPHLRSRGDLPPHAAQGSPVVNILKTGPAQAALPAFLAVDACGACATCVRIARDVFPDVRVLQPGESGSIKIEQVRQIVDASGYRPFEGQRRVIIVDDADALVPAAQNALLKTLEEPPSASVFLLITSRPDVLLPTVRSRCPRLRFSPLAADDIAAALVARGVSAADARAVAATSEGSLGHALQASAGDLAEAREVAERVLGHVAESNDPRNRLDAAKELVAKTGSGAAIDREQLRTYLRAMSALLRDLARLGARSGRGVQSAPGGHTVDPADRLSASFRGERAVAAFSAVDRGLVALERNASAKIVADWVALNL